MADYLEEGHGCKPIFHLNPGIRMRFISSKPPGFDGGEFIDLATMDDAPGSVRPMAPQSLFTATDITGTVAYDPACLTDLLAIKNQNGQITYQFSDGSSWVVWGALRVWDPQEATIGGRPTANVTIGLTNRNASKVKSAPTYSTSGGAPTTTSTTITTTTAAP